MSADRSYRVTTIALIGLTLLASVLIDLSVRPRDHFVSSPFAIPILIAALRLSTRGLGLTIGVAVVAAIYMAQFDKAPFVPALFHLAGLLFVGYIATLLGGARRTADQRAHEAEAERSWLGAVIERSPLGIILIRARDGIQVIANHQAEVLFGKHLPPRGGLAALAGQIHQPDGGLLATDNLPGARALRGETVAAEEMVIQQPLGQRVPVLVSAGPIRDPDGNLLGAVVLLEDITLMKELEKLREEWTSIIAHDLRQPVTIIVGYASLLAKQAPELRNPVHRQAVEHILTSARNLNKMIGDLLDLSRIAAKRLKIEEQPVDLPDLVKSVVERNAEITTGHLVDVEVRGRIPTIMADPSRIEQVLGNLLSNAVKYGYPDTAVDMCVVGEDHQIEVSVTNRGPGIAPDELPQLFNRFYRTREVAKSKISGLGLGLYISRGIVQAHGGQIWAKSSPGQTTTFYFTLPVRP